jgi:hypothetical protein
MELTGDEKLYIELDNGKKVSCQNCFVDFLGDDKIVVSRRISDKIYTTTYYESHIVYYTLTIDSEHGVDKNEQH